MSITTTVTEPATAPPTGREPAAVGLAPVVALDDRRRPARVLARPAEGAAQRQLDEAGAASAEYAAVTACGVGLAGVLLKLLTSDFGQNLLKTLVEFFLKMVGIG